MFRDSDVHLYWDECKTCTYIHCIMLMFVCCNIGYHSAWCHPWWSWRWKRLFVRWVCHSVVSEPSWGYYNTLSSLFSKTRALSCEDVPVRTILVVTVAKLTLGYDCLITCIYGCGSGMSAFKLAVRARGRRIRDNIGSWHTTGRSSLWIVTCRTVLIFVVSFEFDVLFLEWIFCRYITTLVGVSR